MGRQHPIRIAQVPSDVGDLQGRGVARQNRMLGGGPLQPFKDPSLQLQVLGDRFGHEVRPRSRLLEIGRGADARKRPLRGCPADPSRIAERLKVLPDLFEGARKNALVHILEHDLAAPQGENLSDAVPHEAGPDDRGIPDGVLYPSL